MAISLVALFVAVAVGFWLLWKGLSEVIRAENHKTREALESAVSRFEKAVKTHGCPMADIHERFKVVESSTAETAKTLNDHKIRLERIAKSCIMSSKHKESAKAEGREHNGISLPLAM